MTASYQLLTPDDVNTIAERAWQNVATFSSEYSPLSILSSLVDDLDLVPSDQLEHLAAIQYLLSSEFRSFACTSSRLASRLAQTTLTQEEVVRSAVGLVDWPRTTTGRMTGALDPTSYRTRSSRVDLDVPENRLFHFMIVESLKLANDILSQGGPEGWTQAVVEDTQRLARVAKSPLIRTLPSEASRAGILAAISSRIPGYREVANAYALFDGLFRRGDRELLLNLFKQCILLPQAEERAFELLVLFRLVDYLEEAGGQLKSIRLIGRGDGPTYTYQIGDRRFCIHFQNVPRDLLNDSVYLRFASACGFKATARRPDVVLRVIENSQVRRTIIFEAKCSRSADVLRDGLFQLLSYATDYQLVSKPNTTLVLVAHGGVPRRERWPKPAISDPVIGTCTALENLDACLESLELTTW
jgi:hypothetical protein